MKKLVPESLNESLKDVLTGPSPSHIKDELNRKANLYNIKNPEKKINIDLEIFVDDKKEFLEELKPYGISVKLSDIGNVYKILHAEDGHSLFRSPMRAVMTGKRKSLGVWAVEHYDIEPAELDEFFANYTI
jgi:hypothetical protein